MKKLIAMILALIMVFSMVACGGNDTETETETKGTETETETETESETEGELTIGQDLLKNFKSMVSAGTTSAQELADGVLQNERIQFMSGSMPFEPGFLPGFDNDITGFKEAVMFGPMMGSIAFVGYVFVLEDEAQAPDFMEMLKSNGNPR